jgi:DNA-binding beta-propeller fold protein YncE
VRAYTGRGRARLSKWLRAVAVGADGRLYVADSAHARVVVLDRHGTPLHTWGAAGTTHGEMTLPLDLAASRRGDLFVVGTYGILSPIYLFSRARRYRRSWYAGGRVAIGHHWFAPTALALAPDGSQWVTDSVNGLVRHLGAADGAFLGALPGDGGHTLRDPGGLAIGRAGEVYVADTGHGRVVRFAPDGRFLGSFGSTGPRRWRLRRPAALALDAHGDLYVADPGHDRIEKLGPSGAPIAVWGAVRGIGPLRGPDGIAVDARGHVFVSDRGEDRILELTSRGRLLTAWGRSGTGPGELGAPGGLSVDCRGEVLVADTQNNRVQVFTHAAARCAGSTHP